MCFFIFQWFCSSWPGFIKCQSGQLESTVIIAKNLKIIPKEEKLLFLFCYKEALTEQINNY